jgi:hypothetical protein
MGESTNKRSEITVSRRGFLKATAGIAITASTSTASNGISFAMSSPSRLGANQLMPLSADIPNKDALQHDIQDQIVYSERIVNAFSLKINPDEEDIAIIEKHQKRKQQLHELFLDVETIQSNDTQMIASFYDALRVVLNA